MDKIMDLSRLSTQLILVITHKVLACRVGKKTIPKGRLQRRWCVLSGPLGSSSKGANNPIHGSQAEKSFSGDKNTGKLSIGENLTG